MMIQKETYPDFLSYGTNQNDIQRVQTINNIMIWLQHLFKFCRNKSSHLNFKNPLESHLTISINNFNPLVIVVKCT